MASNPPANATKEKSSRSLTVSAKAMPPPVLTETAQVAVDLKRLAQALRIDSETSLETLRAMLPNIEQLRASWRALDQPASYDQIAKEALFLTTSMAFPGNIKGDVLHDSICEGLAEMRPTAFVLARACRAHFKNSEFLSFHKLAKEIRRLTAIAERNRFAINHDAVQHIERLEIKLREEAELDAEEEARHLARERRRVKRIFQDHDGAPPEEWETFFGIPAERAAVYQAAFSGKKRRSNRRG
ncbi:hypothetical protein IVB27_25380 [Bradyrhizobium sp. 197]|uniref:hypothetical protein n=1 Tax=Bradyrhizobium sp. 197 TaxID=2782663 RepID=UPI001FFA9663|nr:hypothetical protein [Bradyrhizobium sp. 197]MCK1478043.1 hypothetical protein [Bradyrhizobium sp. 197]